MIYKEFDSNDFVNEFEAYGRADSWSAAGLEELFNYLDESGQDMEMDVIALDCSFSEYEQNELINQYDYLVDLDQLKEDFAEENDLDSIEDADEFELNDYIEAAIVAELEDRTTVLSTVVNTWVIEEF